MTRERIRTALRWLLGAIYFVAGVIYLAAPAPFIRIVPPFVPAPATLVMLTGLAEIAGALGLVQTRWPGLRRAAGIGLALYALCVWPANVQHMLIDLARPTGSLGLGYHVPRLAAQPLIIWLALWVGNVTDWPLRRRK